MANIDDLVLPDNGFQTRGSRQLLWDIWYILRSKTGLNKLLDLIAERVGSRQIPVFDQYGKPVGTTSKDDEASWNKTNFGRVRNDLDAIKKQLAAIATPTLTLTDAQVASLAKQVAASIPVTDKAGLAKAVVDEIYTRIKPIGA